MTPDQERDVRDAMVPHLEAIKALIKGRTTIAVVVLTPDLADGDVVVTDNPDIRNVVAAIFRRYPEVCIGCAYCGAADGQCAPQCEGKGVDAQRTLDQA